MPKPRMFRAQKSQGSAFEAPPKSAPENERCWNSNRTRLQEELCLACLVLFALPLRLDSGVDGNVKSQHGLFPDKLTLDRVGKKKEEIG
jgi:hypothetical protein